MSTISNLFYALVFQAGWFVCIMAGSCAAFLYTLIFLTIHFLFVFHRNTKSFARKEILWIVTISGFGLLIEIISFSFGLLYNKDKEILFSYLSLPPLWLLCIWITFSLILRTCLAFLFTKPLISYLLLLVFVPVNYYAGAELNKDVAINEPYLLSLSLITLMWLLFFWCSNYLKRRYFEELFNAH